MQRRVQIYFLATFLSPLFTLPVISVFLIVMQMVRPGSIFDPILFRLFVSVGLMIAYGATVIFGIPISFVLNRIGRLNAHYHALAGGFVGVLLALASFQAISVGEIMPMISLYGLCGVTTGYVFGVIVNRELRNASDHSSSAT